jgi:hypothetical protein
MYSYSSILSLNVACCGKNGMEKSWIDFGSDGWEGGFHGPVCYIYSNAHDIQDDWCLL